VGEVHINLFIIKLKNCFILFNIKLNNYFTLFFNVINNLYIPGKRRNHRNARVAVAVVKLAAEAQRGIIRHTDEHNLTQGAIPQLRVWDVHLAEEADATSVDAIAHPVDGERRLLFHPALPQKVVLNEDLLLPDADDDIVRKDGLAAAIRMLLAGAPTIAPVCPHDI
jgi:hypothetical protein